MGLLHIPRTLMEFNVRARAHTHSAHQCHISITYTLKQFIYPAWLANDVLLRCYRIAAVRWPSIHLYPSFAKFGAPHMCSISFRIVHTNGAEWARQNAWNVNGVTRFFFAFAFFFLMMNVDIILPGNHFRLRMFINTIWMQYFQSCTLDFWTLSQTNSFSSCKCMVNNRSNKRKQENTN